MKAYGKDLILHTLSELSNETGIPKSKLYYLVKIGVIPTYNSETGGVIRVNLKDAAKAAIKYYDKEPKQKNLLSAIGGSKRIDCVPLDYPWFDCYGNAIIHW